MVRQREFSISVTDGEEKIRTRSFLRREKSDDQADTLLVESPLKLSHNLRVVELENEEVSTITVADTTVANTIIASYDGTISMKRKVVGLFAIVLSTGICVVGIAMNTKDVIAFFNK